MDRKLKECLITQRDREKEREKKGEREKERMGKGEKERENIQDIIIQSRMKIICCISSNVHFIQSIFCAML